VWGVLSEFVEKAGDNLIPVGTESHRIASFFCGTLLQAEKGTPARKAHKFVPQ
jgi:hypothetical protein